MSTPPPPPPDPTAVYTAGDFIRRVVESLFRAEFRGRVLCARCLVKQTKEHLDRSYAKRDVVEVIDELFVTPHALQVVTGACGLCAKKKVPCLGLPGSAA